MIAAASRASALRALLAAAALALAACSGSGPGPGPTPPPACKGYDQACGAGGECCSGDCPAGACGCSALAERCGTSNDCCTGGGPARCDGGGTCVSGQRPLGDVCDWDGLCSSLNCDITGHCAPACAGYGTACSSSAQCCGYLGCPAGTCSLACGNDYDPCTTDNECCSDYRCRAGECQAGLCGTAGQQCDSEADCCTVAQGGKEYFCNEYGECDIGRPNDLPGYPPDACATDADCAGDYPCRGGFCHWQDGEQQDGQWCLDGQECDGGHCTSTATGVPGTCCSGAGAACSVGGYATVCCAGLDLSCTGVAGAQSCGSCLDFTNSGPQGTAETQCTSDTQCCRDRNLGCFGGECCSRRGTACTAGTGEVECCAGDTCGDVTDYQGTKTVMCCGTFGERCGYDSPCCDGLLCGYDGTCHLAAGEACTDHAQCADYSGCKIETPPEGVCCGHDMARCDTDADCCSGNCDEAYGSCEWAQEYGPCLDDSDCGSSAWGAWDGTVCGGNDVLGPHVCCPVPGDSCQSPLDCCEAGNSCKARLTGPDTTTPRCCREAGASADDGTQCCTGMSERRSPTSIVETCCAYPYMTTFTCTSDADCCDGGGTIGSRCGLIGGVNRCCWETGFSVGEGNGALCCSGSERFGACR